MAVPEKQVSFILICCCVALCSLGSADGLRDEGDEMLSPNPVVQAGYGVIQRLLGEQYTGNFTLCEIQVRTESVKLAPLASQ